MGPRRRDGSRQEEEPTTKAARRAHVHHRDGRRAGSRGGGGRPRGVRRRLPDARRRRVRRSDAAHQRHGARHVGADQGHAGLRRERALAFPEPLRDGGGARGRATPGGARVCRARRRAARGAVPPRAARRALAAVPRGPLRGRRLRVSLVLPARPPERADLPRDRRRRRHARVTDRARVLPRRRLRGVRRPAPDRRRRGLLAGRREKKHRRGIASTTGGPRGDAAGAPDAAQRLGPRSRVPARRIWGRPLLRLPRAGRDATRDPEGQSRGRRRGHARRGLRAPDVAQAGRRGRGALLAQDGGPLVLPVAHQALRLRLRRAGKRPGRGVLAAPARHGRRDGRPRREVRAGDGRRRRPEAGLRREAPEVGPHVLFILIRVRPSKTPEIPVEPYIPMER